MPRRPLDEDFGGETLYRAIKTDWIRNGVLTYWAVTLPGGTSFDRSKYQSAPQATLDRARQRDPEHDDVAHVLADEVPTVKGRERADAPDARECQWKMMDDPLGEEDDSDPNEAHCQAVVRVVGTDAEPALSHGAMRKLRTALAERLQPMGLGKPSP